MLDGLERPQWCPVAVPLLSTGAVVVLSVRCPCGALSVLWWSVLNCTSHDNLHVYSAGEGALVARCRLRHRAVTRMPDKGAVQCVKELLQECCICYPHFLLRVDGARHLSRHQLMDLKDQAQVGPGSGFAGWWGEMTSACCRPSRWNPQAADHCLVCSQRRLAHGQRQQRACPGCELPALLDTIAARGSGSTSGGNVVGLSIMAVSLGSVELTASGSQCRATGCGVILTLYYWPLSNTTMETVLGVPRPAGSTYVSGPTVYRSTVFRRLLPLSGAVQLSQAERPLYDRMLRAPALSCGTALSWPLGLGAGRGPVSGAMSLCEQARWNTHTHPWSGWWRLNHQVHASRRPLGQRSWGLRSAWHCLT